MGSLRGKRMYERWSDRHRQDVLGTTLRKLAYQEARFDSTLSPGELAGLAEEVTKAEKVVADFYYVILALEKGLADLKDNVSEWQVLFGLEEYEDILHRLSAPVSNGSPTGGTETTGTDSEPYNASEEPDVWEA